MNTNTELLEALKVATGALKKLHQSYGMEVAAYVQMETEEKGFSIYDFYRIIREAEEKLKSEKDNLIYDAVEESGILSEQGGK